MSDSLKKRAERGRKKAEELGLTPAELAGLLLDKASAKSRFQAAMEAEGVPLEELLQEQKDVD